MTGRALLLDLDGVLRIWSADHVRPAERTSGLPVGAIRRTAFAKDILMPAITGQASDQQWRQEIVKRLQIEFPAADCARAVKMWSKSVGMVDQDVLAFVQEFRRSGPVVLVTNATTRLPQDLKELGLSGEFDTVVNSSTIGAAKPDEAIYNAALSAAGVEPCDAIFVDDASDNVDAAVRLGMAGHLYRGIRTLRAELVRAGIIASENAAGSAGRHG